MNFNRNKHCSFVQWLDRTAEKCPLLWLPCVLLIALALVGERIFEYARIAYRYRNTEKVIKEKPQGERKPFAMRAAAVMLAVALTFMIVPEMDSIISFNIFAEETNVDDFDVYMYIADDIIYDKSDSTDDTNFYSSYAYDTMNFYYGEFRSMGEIWVSSMTPEFEGSVKVWETTNLILSPGDIGKKAVDAREYYVNIILDMMNSSYESDTIINKLYSSNTKQANAMCKYFSDFLQAYTQCDLKDFLNKRDYTQAEMQGMYDAQKEMLKKNNWVKSVSDADKVLKILKSANTVQDYVDSFISYCQIANICQEWKGIIDYMYANCDHNNYALVSALEFLKNFMESDDMMNAAFNMLVEDGVMDLASWGFSKCVGKVTDLIIRRFPAFSGIKIGTELGKNLANMLTGTDKIVEEYHMVKAYSEIMNLLRGAYKNAERTYVNNKSTQTANAFLSYVNIYFTALDVGNDYGKEFADAICNGGIRNKILYSKDQYDFYVKHHSDFKKYISWACDTVNTHWINNLYFDRPDLYEIYAPIVKNEHSRIDPTRIEFEQDSVEWGLDDVEFNGAKYTVYPAKATNKEVIIKSSDESVATLDNYGNVRVYKPGTCQITVTTFMNEFVSDTLNVTVVEGHGADGLTLPEIIPFEPSKPEKPKFEYVSENGEVTITGYIGDDVDIVIPDDIEGVPVTQIGNSAFYKKTNIKSVIIPNGVEEIGYDAFAYCEMLETVIIPETLKAIKSCAFDNCVNLNEINLPEGLTYIGISAFSSCTSLTAIELPDSLTDIGYNAFSDCDGLTKIIIPKGIINFISHESGDGYGLSMYENGFFSKCDNLKVAIFSEGITCTSQIMRGCTSLETVILPNSITEIGSMSFAHCENLSKIAFPNTITKIGSSAFSSCVNLESIAIPDSVKEIEDYAFSGCTKLKDVSLASGLEAIGKESFKNCSSLNDVYVPNTVKEVRSDAFENCQNAIVYYPSTADSSFNRTTKMSIEYTEKENDEISLAVTSSSLSKIIIPQTVYFSFNNKTYNVTYIDKIYSKSVEEIILPDSVIGLGNDAFRGNTQLKNIDLPNHIDNIPPHAFYQCKKLDHIDFPETITSIGSYAFGYCESLKEISFPQNLVEIGDYSFEHCDNLNDLHFAQNGSLSRIRNYAFKNCNALKEVILPTTVSDISSAAFTGDKILFYPMGSLKYDSHGENSFQENGLAIGYSTNGFSMSVGGIITPYTEITIPKKVNLQDGNGEYTVVQLSDSAFSGAKNVERIHLPDSITYIGSKAFQGRNHLTYVNIPQNLEYVGRYAFAQCPEITDIELPDTVTYIGRNAFWYCQKLANIKLPKTITAIPMQCFDKCEKLESIIIPDGVTSIHSTSFQYCYSLNKIVIPRSVTQIGGFYKSENVVIYGYRNSFAETYANRVNIPFVALDDIPLETIGSLIEFAPNKSQLAIDATKYGDIVSLADISAAKDKNLTLIIRGNNYSWKVKATDLPNAAVDFKLILPSGEVDKTRFKEIYKNRSYDFKTVNPSGAELTYDVGAENNGCCANIFKVDNGSFTLISSNMIENGKTVFTPSDNSVYGIVVSADSESIDIDELFEEAPVESAVLNSLSVNNVNISDFSPDKLNYTYSVSYEDWLADVSRTYNISAYASDSVNITVSENNFTLNSDNYDIAVSKDIIITATNSNGSETVYTIKFVVEACPHTIKNETISIEPTCTTLGEKETECSVCGKRFGIENIPALGHAFDNGTNTAESDCINMGTVLYQCSRCDESFTRTIPARGHNWGKVTVDTAADCTTDGISARYCAACGTRRYETLIPALGHSFSAWTKVDDITYERICSICGKKETKTVSNVEHDHIFNGTVDVIIPASCQAVGSQNIYCSVEGCTEFVTEEIAKTAHIPAEAVNINATCTTAGSSTVHCKECNTKLSETELPATGHSFTNYTDAATCTLPGKKTAMCDNGCGESDNIPTPAKGHNYGEWLNDITGHWHECSECGNKTSVISHSENDGVVTTPATETTSGVKTYSCSVCDYVMKTEEIPPITHIHDLSSTYSSDKIGHWYACSKCDEKVNFAPHIETSKTTVEPTISTKGERTYYCSVCDYVIRTEEIPPITHTHDLFSTYSSDKTGHWYDCSKCDEKVDFAAHTEDKGTVTLEATETTDGIMTYKCSVCGYVMRTKTIPAGHKHKFGTDWKTDSVNHWHECTCGEKSDLGVHTEDRGTVTVQPTATTSGTRTYSCSKCGYVMRTETIPATGYNPYPSAPTYPVVSPVPITSENEIEVTLESDLSGISEGKVHFSTKKRFFKNSAVVTVSNTETANNAASMAISYLSGDAEHNIIYPFDISIYNADTHEKMQLRERGYIIFEIPVPDILVSKTDEIGVYHIVDGKPEAIKSRIVEKGGVNKIRFTADSFSPYMFAAYSENGMEDVSSGAGVTANSIPIDFAEPTTNGVGMPSARLPQIMKFSNKKRKYRILRKRRLDDLVFVF